MIQVARNKNGVLVIGENLVREERYELKEVWEESYHNGDPYKTMVEDKTKPLPSEKWRSSWGSSIYQILDETLFSEWVKDLTWEDEPITISKYL